MRHTSRHGHTFLILLGFIACFCPMMQAQRTYRIVWIDEFRKRERNVDRFAAVGHPELSSSLKELCTDLCQKKNIYLDDKKAFVSKISMAEEIAGTLDRNAVRAKLRKSAADTLDFGILTLYVNVKERSEYSVTSEIITPMVVGDEVRFDGIPARRVFRQSVPYTTDKGSMKLSTDQIVPLAYSIAEALHEFYQEPFPDKKWHISAVPVKEIPDSNYRWLFESVPSTLLTKLVEEKGSVLQKARAGSDAEAYLEVKFLPLIPREALYRMLVEIKKRGSEEALAAADPPLTMNDFAKYEETLQSIARRLAEKIKWKKSRISPGVPK